MNVNAKVAAHKTKYPEAYCSHRHCLWRTALLNHETQQYERDARYPDGRCPRHEKENRIMGLDVIAFSRAKLIEGGDPDFWHHVYSANGIDRMDGKPEGRYCGESEFSFRAGSYGGYNDFRSWLIKAFIGAEPKIVWENGELYRGKPFYELVNFGDN